MKQFINRYATPLITGLFAVSLVSGIALFFHWAPGSFHGMHEWLSMVLIIPFVLHVYKNWRGLLAYVKRKTMMIPLVLCVLAGVAFAVPGFTGSAGGGNPAFRAISLMTNAPISVLAPVLQKDSEDLMASLREKGFDVTSADQTLDMIAKTGDTSSAQLLISLMAAR